MEFGEWREREWEIGSAARRANSFLGVQTDPTENVQIACAAVANWSERLLEHGEIGIAEAQRLYDMSLDIYLFMESVRGRRSAAA